MVVLSSFQLYATGLERLKDSGCCNGLEQRSRPRHVECNNPLCQPPTFRLSTIKLSQPLEKTPLILVALPRLGECHRHDVLLLHFSLLPR